MDDMVPLQPKERLARDAALSFPLEISCLGKSTGANVMTATSLISGDCVNIPSPPCASFPVLPQVSNENAATMYISLFNALISLNQFVNINFDVYPLQKIKQRALPQIVIINPVVL